jgi:hypothetical protein
VRLPLREIEREAPAVTPDPLASITAALEVETRQRVSNEGLALTVIVTNSGRESVELQDPDDNIQVSLLDEQGLPVVVPIKPRALVNTRGRSTDPNPNAPRRLRLEPGDEHRATIVVREGQSSDRATRGPLPPGTYRIQVDVLLLSLDPDLEQARAYRRLVSDRVEIEWSP